MKSDGSNVVRLTHDNFLEGRPSWTPDGTKIAFSSFCKLNCDIFTVDPDVGNPTRLAKHKMQDVRPSWSPDGSKIAFISFRDGGMNDPFHVFVMNADGEGRHNLTGDTHLTYSFSPTWSPDGRKIAFDSQRNFKGYDIYVITADGKELEQLTEDGASWSPAYSPDGTKIAYVSHRDGDYNIYVMDTNGTNAVKITRTPLGADNVSPSWLPLGAFVVNPYRKLPISWGKIKRADNP